MIPTRSSRPPVLASPGMTQMDLAKLIHRVVKMAVDGKRELGFAAVNVGCDGRERTTMFDGSSCQTEGEVCLAERQDGITTCLSRPKQGNGLTFQTIAFTAPVCEPATGWWIVDSAGYMYRVPQALIDAAPYWPPDFAPESGVAIVRSKAWAVLMCGTPLVVPLNGDGGAAWTINGEGDWTQSFAALVGGEIDGWDTGIGLLPKPGFLVDAASWRGVLLRDAMAPNAGLRIATVTLPAADTGVITGAVRVCYGYPFGYRISEMGLGGPSTLAPYPRSNVVGTWQADTVGRVAGDMALCYTRRLVVEYASGGHINLTGDAITDSSDYVDLGEMDLSAGPPQDVAACVLGTPGGEVVLLGPADISTGQRYRVRPAPDAPVTVSVEQQTRGAWNDDPNLWVNEITYGVAPWAGGATSFTVDASIADPGGPGRDVAVVLWETNDPADTYLTAPVTYPGVLGETSGGLTPISVSGSVVASSLAYQYLTVVGIKANACWGWTFEVGGIESALSILTDQGAYGYSLNPPSVLYSVAITVPGGPPGTTVRRVYRFAYDYGSALTGVVAPIGPWAYLSNTGGGLGAVYDRHCRLVKTLAASIPEPGTDPITFYDEDTSLSTAGTRPPSPLIGPIGPVTVAAPLPVHLLQPMNL